MAYILGLMKTPIAVTLPVLGTFELLTPTMPIVGAIMGATMRNNSGGGQQK